MGMKLLQHRVWKGNTHNSNIPLSVVRMKIIEIGLKLSGNCVGNTRTIPARSEGIGCVASDCIFPNPSVLHDLFLRREKKKSQRRKEKLDSHLQCVEVGMVRLHASCCLVLLNDY